MRDAIAVLIVCALLISSGIAEPSSVRQVQGIDLSVFTCTPNPGHHLIGSQADIGKILAELAPHCPSAVFDQRRAAFLRDVRNAGLNWNDEVLVIAEDWFGTGMAKPSLVFSGPSDGILTATIAWKTPQGPVTPDTASCRFAFAVSRSAVRKIQVVGQHSGTATFVVSP